MPDQALYLKWRPRSFDHVIGQEHIKQTLRSALVQNRVRHAYMFNGPRGTGKTTMARILAKAVNCLHENPAERPCDQCQFCTAVNEGRFLDLIEIDAASHNGVDDVRDLRDKIAFAPSEGRYKVYIIDEVHRFTPQAFDALLKTLEEPPDHALFILATTELDKVPATIKSRSLMFEFRRVSMKEVADRLQMIVEFEGIKVDRAALELVARLGTGSVRDSISLLDQLISDPTQKISLESAEQVLGTASNRVVGKLVQSIIDNDVAVGLDLLNQAIDEGADPAQLGRQIVEYLRNVLIAQTGGAGLIDSSDEIRTTLQHQAQSFGRAALLRTIRAFNTAVAEIKGGWQPQLPLELALVESTRPIHEDVSTSVEAPRPAAIKSAPTAKEKAAPIATNEGSAPQSSGSVSLSDIKRAWPAILDSVRQLYQPTRAVLDHAKAMPKSIEGKVFTISISAPDFKDKLENAKHRDTLLKAISTQLGVELTIRVIIGTDSDSQAVSDTIADDPLLGELMKSGGKIKSIEDNSGGTD